MKKFASLFTALLGGLLALSACGKTDKSSDDGEQGGDPAVHSHVDIDHNHYCDECFKKISEHEIHSVTHSCIYCGEVFPTIDSNIDGKCDYCDDHWSEDTKALFNENLGEILPFFKTDSGFEEKPYYIEAVISGNAVNDLVDNFTSTGLYTSSTGDYVGVEATFLTKLAAVEDTQINVMIIYNQANNVTYVDAYTSGIEATDFPIAKVKNVLNGYTSENVIIPDDGTAFIFEKGETEGYCSVTYNGDADAYLTKLVNAGYYIDYSMMDYYLFPAIRAISSGRTLAIQITDKTTEATIEFMGVTAPNEVAWSDEIKDYMTGLIDEVIPFANANFALAENAEETIEEKDYFQLESYNIDAFKYALNAMKSDSSWNEEYEEDGNFYSYTKDFGVCQKKVVISVLWSITTISIMKVFPEYNDFPIDQIIACIGDGYTDTIIPAPGDSYHLYYEPDFEGIANLTVYGDHQDYVDYIDALEKAGYKVTSTGDGWDVAIGPEKTIQLDMCDYTEVLYEGDVSFYKVEYKVIEPEEELADFPTKEFEEEMDDDLDFSTVPMPTGTSFVVGYPYGKGMCDIMVTITGGDMAGYTQSILDAGFIHYEAWDYDNYKCYQNTKLNIVIYIYDLGENTTYAVEFGRINL